MVQRIDWILQLTRTMTREEFADDLRSLLAVQAAFAQLGEASIRVDNSVKLAHPEIEWQAIRQFRNFVIHVYDRIDPEKLYDTATEDLSPLREKLRLILNEETADE